MLQIWKSHPLWNINERKVIDKLFYRTWFDNKNSTEYNVLYVDKHTNASAFKNIFKYFHP